MPRFSSRSMQELETCHRDLQLLFKTVVFNVDCSVLCGHRGETAQNIAFNKGNSKVNWPDSKHNKTPAMAVDVVPYPVDWDDREGFQHFAGYVLGVAEMLHYEGMMVHKVKWGGHFDNFFDGAHFELVGI